MGNDRPKRMHVNPGGIPAGMKEKNNWVLWHWERRKGKWDKPPYQIDGSRASSTDPATWTDFETAYKACQNGGKWDGIGFSLNGEYVAIDWDNCRDPQGNIKSEVLRHIKEIDSYTEISPSRRGLKTYAKGKLPKDGHHKNFGSIEVGVFDSGRYVCITGHAIPGVSPRIEPRQEQLDNLIRRYWPEDYKPKAEPTRPQATLSLNDQELIDKASAANDDAKFRRLWAGDHSDYTSQSEADLALCCKLAFWTGNDAARIDSLFRQSGLMRDKWEREDYRRRTIDKAIEGGGETYQPQHPPPHCGSTPQPPPPKSYHLTDTGNGERFADQHRENVKFCFPTKCWFVWDDIRWKPDNEGVVRLLAKQTTRKIYDEAAAEPDPDKSQKIGKWAAGSESSYRQEAMLKLAQSEPGIPILPEQMDRNEWLLNVENGTIDLKTGELLPHRKNDLITKLAPVKYDPEAKCPRWLEFLDTIMGGDDEMVNYLCRVAGYTLTGDAGEQCLFVFHGNGENGKSTLLNVLQSILEDYAMQTSFDTFTIKKK